MVWPYYQQNVPSTFTLTNTYGSDLTVNALIQIRSIIAEEIHKALHPETTRPSATVEYEHDGKRWKGIVYLAEDEGEEEGET